MSRRDIPTWVPYGSTWAELPEDAEECYEDCPSLDEDAEECVCVHEDDPTDECDECQGTGRTYGICTCAQRRKDAEEP